MIKKFTVTFGIIFIVLGIIAFFPNPIIGHHGLFKANFLHSLIHVLTGLILILISKYSQYINRALEFFGIIFLSFALLGIMTVGFTMKGGEIFGSILLNGFDHVLHLIIGLLFLYFSKKKDDEVIVINN